jgi:hypothetical protein
LSLPLTISTPTDFCLASPGPYDVSCKVGTTEVADGTSPKRVQAGSVPVLVAPNWERDLAGGSGGSSVVPTAKTSAYTAASGDAVLADASGGAFTVTLPAPASAARVTVKNVGATGVVTVAPHAAETIDGASSFALASQWMSRDFLADGTNWLVV